MSQFLLAVASKKVARQQTAEALQFFNISGGTK